MINSDNWRYCSYKSSELEALITQGAYPDPRGKPILVYYLTLLDGDFQEVFQEEFSLLSEAICALNQRYRHWQWTDRKNAPSGPSCHAR